ncbi:MAG: hypothetical protein KC766_11315 [Myxococcales bacterium]|nr:hypothetical protein [Myxococcales bacterium]
MIQVAHRRRQRCADTVLRLQQLLPATARPARGLFLTVLLAMGLPAMGCSSESGGGSGAAGASAGGAGAAAPGGSGGTNPGGNSAGDASVGGSAGVSSGGAAGSGGVAGAGAGDGGACASATPFAVRAVDHQFGSGQTFGQQDFPANVLGGPRGGGCCGGSLDVVSLGIGGWVVLELGDTVVDGPGVDLLVFENAFEYGSGSLYAEPATVAVSADGETWYEFPCDAQDAPWGQCAGTHPVYANVDENDLDPTDPENAGGDGYDLADVGVERARFVRLTDRADLTSSVFDLDAVAVVHGECTR